MYIFMYIYIILELIYIHNIHIHKHVLLYSTFNKKQNQVVTNN